MVFDWRWYPNDPGASAQLYNQSIIRASRRGVKIEAISNCDAIVALLNGEKISAKKLKIKSLVHAKVLIIDGRSVVVGSHNYTQAAFTTNQELSVYLPDCEKIEIFLNFFNSLWRL